jgi:hypothetical protein
VNLAKRGQPKKVEQAETSMELSHLRRDSRTALELAVVAMAPSELVDRLATAAGLLEALVELPADSAPVLALVPELVARTRGALEDWEKWRSDHLDTRFPQG